MRILLTGGSGDLGQVLAGPLTLGGDTPVNFDIRTPMSGRCPHIKGSILDRRLLQQSLEEIECIVHIAAWHGIHEAKKDAYDFWDLNVTGTFNVFEAAVRSGVKCVIYISSTSVRDEKSVYGHTKVLGEAVAKAYANRHSLNIITLRPRAFIPYWNKEVYTSYLDWAKWFWTGAVHIDDVAQAVIQAIEVLKQRPLLEPLVLTLDGAYEYTDEDLSDWDREGPGSTFRKYYEEFYDLAVKVGLDPTQKPEKLQIQETCQWLGYQPRYSLKNLLLELTQFGIDGPPAPIF